MDVGGSRGQVWCKEEASDLQAAGTTPVFDPSDGPPVERRSVQERPVRRARGGQDLAPTSSGDVTRKIRRVRVGLGWMGRDGEDDW